MLHTAGYEDVPLIDALRNHADYEMIEKPRCYRKVV